MRFALVIGRAWLGILLYTLALTCSAAGVPDPQAAQRLVEQAVADMVRGVRDPATRTDIKQLRALVDRTLLPHVDMSAASRLVLTRHWRDAKPEQRARFEAEFQEFLLRFYTNVLDTYLAKSEVRDDLVRVEPPRAEPGAATIVVHTVVKRPQAEPVPVDYRLYWRDGWKVVDVSIAGVSMVISYRNEFAPLLAKAGLDGLIAELRKRNQSLATVAGR